MDFDINMVVSIYNNTFLMIFFNNFHSIMLIASESIVVRVYDDIRFNKVKNMANVIFYP